MKFSPYIISNINFPFPPYTQKTSRRKKRASSSTPIGHSTQKLSLCVILPTKICTISTLIPKIPTNFHHTSFPALTFPFSNIQIPESKKTGIVTHTPFMHVHIAFTSTPPVASLSFSINQPRIAHSCLSLISTTLLPRFQPREKASLASSQSQNEPHISPANTHFHKIEKPKQ